MIAAKRFTPNYSPQWAAIAALVALVVTAHWVMERKDYPVTGATPAATSSGSDWYMILRMPEVPSSVTDLETTRRVFSRRLDGLLQEGFHPILLSEIHRRQLAHQALPERPIVIVFEPGSRHTFETLRPVLNENRVPVVWTVDRKAVNNAERPFLSRHALSLMTNTGQFDVAYYDGDKPVEIHNQKTVLRLGSIRADAWSGSSGSVALNYAAPKSELHRLSRLNVNPTWTQEEFIDRILAEVPVRETVHLGGHMIGSRLWGITMPKSAPDSETVFTLEAPLDRRGTTLSWMGTRGIANAQLHLHADSVSGELWILLRSDEQEGEAVRVGFSNNTVLLEQQSRHFAKRLTQATVPLTMPLDAVIRIQGSHLAITVNEKKVFDVSYLQPPQSHRGAVRLTVYDKIRGTAQAINVRALLTPLGPSTGSGLPPAS